MKSANNSFLSVLLIFLTASFVQETDFFANKVFKTWWNKSLCMYSKVRQSGKILKNKANFLGLLCIFPSDKQLYAKNNQYTCAY